MTLAGGQVLPHCQGLMFVTSELIHLNLRILRCLEMSEAHLLALEELKAGGAQRDSSSQGGYTEK